MIGAMAAILNLPRLAKARPFVVSGVEFINSQLAYQLWLFGVAAAVLVALLLVNRANLEMFLSVGEPTAPAGGISWMAIGDGESWTAVGLALSIVITLATSAFMIPQFRSVAAGFPQLLPLAPWVVLFAITNALGEEIVYRLGAVVPLAGAVDDDFILLFSAITFGAPHLRGMPNGIVGALMAGVLGWLLAKSVVETEGLFWAWLIHFLQDIVIYSALILTAITPKPVADPALTPGSPADDDG